MNIVVKCLYITSWIVFFIIQSLKKNKNSIYFYQIYDLKTLDFITVGMINWVKFTYKKINKKKVFSNHIHNSKQENNIIATFYQIHLPLIINVESRIVTPSQFVFWWLIISSLALSRSHNCSFCLVMRIISCRSQQYLACKGLWICSEERAKIAGNFD